MEFPKILQGESLTRLLQGAAAGAIATIVVGFNWGGWTLGGTATRMADANARSAVIDALTPICVDNFQRAPGAGANLDEMKKVSSWQQGSFIEKGGWATMPGTEAPNSSVARACAELLARAKL